MKRSELIRLVCYLAAFAFILFHPIRTIMRFSFPSVKGVEYRFPVTAYDPYDPMRGRYVRLNLSDAGRVRLPKKIINLAASSRKACFAVLEKTPDGKAKIVDLVSARKEIPAGKHFIPVKYSWFNRDYDSKKKKYLKTGRHHIRLPFERFYLNERKAPKAEQLLQNRKNKAELIVILYPDGIYQVKDLLINGKSVRGL